MSYNNSPEDRHHGRKQGSGYAKIYDVFKSKTLHARALTYVEKRVQRENPLQSFIRRHQQRMNVAPYLVCAMVFYYFGSLVFYWNFKRDVIVKKVVEDYGKDIPFWRSNKVAHWVQRVRAENVHFYRYRLFYFVEEQVIDPLNDNSLSAKAFDVYQFKRLIRAMKYDEIRDDSFDFLQIGEDDIAEYDDFV